MISLSSSSASSTPATSLKVTFFGWAGEELGPALAEGHGLVAAGLHLAHEEDPEEDEQEDREPADEDGRDQGLRAVSLTTMLTLFSRRILIRSLYCGGQDGLEGLAVRELAAELAVR